MYFLIGQQEYVTHVLIGWQEFVMYVLIGQQECVTHVLIGFQEFVMYVLIGPQEYVTHVLISFWEFVRSLLIGQQECVTFVVWSNPEKLFTGEDKCIIYTVAAVLAHLFQYSGQNGNTMGQVNINEMQNKPIF